MIISGKVVETSINVNRNNPSQECAHRADHRQCNYGMTPELKPFTILKLIQCCGVVILRYSFLPERAPEGFLTLFRRYLFKPNLKKLIQKLK